MADLATKRAQQILFGLNRPTFLLYPLPTGAPAANALITPGAAAWALYTDIIAANAITVEFWLFKVVFTVSAGAHGLREIQIYNATETRTVYECRVDVTAATANIADFDIPIPIYCSPNAQIQARAGATNAADTIRVGLIVGTGL